MPQPTTLFFDINETLLDLAPLKTSVGAVLDGREDLLPLWFTTLLHYSLVDTMTDNYRPFAQIGVAVLMMLAGKHGIHLSRDAAEEAVLAPFAKLPPHPDVPPAMRAFKDAGFHMVALANSAAAGIAAQFEFADLTRYFDRRISTEEVGAFKPDPRTYAHGLKATGKRPDEVLMVAAHAWDLAGAKKAGLQTAFIARPGQALYPNTQRPDHVVDNLMELADILIP
ncbi:MAG: haloacid dehalogenase type II [Rhodospirillum sp.]|nr:haloacid dehalogenase type II [Rhodospirillum sp.]MCF8489275.1 haloacid dehalogenase type II [Rhodospirillum sp.]